MFQHLLNLSLSFFNRRKTGELMSRLHNDTAAAFGPMERIISTFVYQPMLIVVYLTALGYTNYKLALVTFLVALVHTVISSQIGKRLRRRIVAKWDSFTHLTSIVQEAFLSIRVVKAFSAEHFEANHFASEVREYEKVERKLVAISYAEGPLRVMVNRLAVSMVVLFASIQLVKGEMTTSGFLLFLFFSQRLLGPITSIGEAIVELRMVSGSAERAFELLETQPEVKNGSQVVTGFKRSLALRDVSFSYGDELVLRNLGLEIRKGEMVALIGPSGVGKSTLTDLLLRFYDPTEGIVELDGVDIRRFTQASYRRLFGVVSQENLLFNDTVHNNIAYGRSDITDEEIIWAARIANAHDFVMQLPQGYDTLVGDRGIRLSGGQRQRIAIARAVVTCPPILIFDEATSALDSESERLVQQAIEQVIKGSTAIVVAQRLSTVQMADRIVVLDKGQIVEMGTHAELLEKGGLYKRLCEMQFRDNVEVGELKELAKEVIS